MQALHVEYEHLRVNGFLAILGLSTDELQLSKCRCCTYR